MASRINAGLLSQAQALTQELTDFQAAFSQMNPQEKVDAFHALPSSEMITDLHALAEKIRALSNIPPKEGGVQFLFQPQKKYEELEAQYNHAYSIISLEKSAERMPFGHEVIRTQLVALSEIGGMDAGNLRAIRGMQQRLGMNLEGEAAEDEMTAAIRMSLAGPAPAAEDEMEAAIRMSREGHDALVDGDVEEAINRSLTAHDAPVEGDLETAMRRSREALDAADDALLALTLRETANDAAHRAAAERTERAQERAQQDEAFQVSLFTDQLREISSQVTGTPTGTPVDHFNRALLVYTELTAYIHAHPAFVGEDTQETLLRLHTEAQGLMLICIGRQRADERMQDAQRLERAAGSPAVTGLLDALNQLINDPTKAIPLPPIFNQLTSAEKEQFRNALQVVTNKQITDDPLKSSKASLAQKRDAVLCMLPKRDDAAPAAPSLAEEMQRRLAAAASAAQVAPPEQRAPAAAAAPANATLSLGEIRDYALVLLQELEASVRRGNSAEISTGLDNLEHHVGLPEGEKNIAHALFGLMYELHVAARTGNSSLADPNDGRFHHDFGRNAFTATFEGVDSSIKVQAIQRMIAELKRAWGMQ